jgi:hypothetical protein
MPRRIARHNSTHLFNPFPTSTSPPWKPPLIASFSSFASCRYTDLRYARVTQDISSAEQVSLHDLPVPELSPSDPISNASSPSSSAPVTPLDPPSFAATLADPLGHGKHQPDPRPFRPVSKSASRLGTVWRASAREVLLGLGKRKRRASAETGISMGVDSELLADYYNVPELPDSNNTPEIIEPRLSQPPPSLFSLPNVPIDSMPVRPRSIISIISHQYSRPDLTLANTHIADRKRVCQAQQHKRHRYASVRAPGLLNSHPPSHTQK